MTNLILTKSTESNSTENRTGKSTWMLRVIATSYHFGVMGVSGTGKYKLINDLTEAYNQVHGESTETVIIDPKYPMTHWSIRPKHKGLLGAAHGLKELSDEIDERVKLAREDINAHSPIRTFPKKLYFLDEADLLARFNDALEPDIVDYLKQVNLPARKAFSSILYKANHRGGNLNLSVGYSSLSPDATCLGLKETDLRLVTKIYLGELIPSAIKKVATKPNQEALLALYEGFCLQPDRKLGLVKIPDEIPFLTDLVSGQIWTVTSES